MMRTECLLLDRIPHTSQLFRDFLERFEKVASYYPSAPFQPSAFSQQSAILAQDYPASRREAVAQVLTRQSHVWRGSEQVFSNLERFRSGAMAIVTGQQVALFGGPLFSVLKAVTAIKLARENSDRGVDCVPIFWMATEDHDIAEVSTFHYRVEGQMRSLQIHPQIQEHAPVGMATLQPEITAHLDQLALDLGDSQVIDLLRECYQPGARMGDAFARLFSRLFAQHGLILIDPNDPELHQIAAPFFQRAIKTADITTKELLQRSKTLEDAGYAAQVKVTPSSTNLFLIRDGARHSIQRSNGGYSADHQRISREDLLKIAESAPESLSAGVLLRPAMQDFLLPTLTYIGGPAEVAYFAQSEVLYRQVLGRVTPIVPRISATLIEKTVQRKLLEVSDLFVSSEATRQLLAERSLPASLTEEMEAAKLQIAQLTDSLQQEIRKLDPTLVDAAARAASKMSYQIERLRRRVANAHAIKQQETSRAADLLSTSLYPHAALQERTLGGTYFLAAHGLGLLDEMFASLQTTCPDHQILYL